MMLITEWRQSVFWNFVRFETYLETNVDILTSRK